MSDMKKADWVLRRAKMVHSFSIAAELIEPNCKKRRNGKHPILRMMGSLAWGRYHEEGQPDERVGDIAEGVGSLKGRRAVLMAACDELASNGDEDTRAEMYRVRRILVKVSDQ